MNADLDPVTPDPLDRIRQAEQMTAVELARRADVSKQRAHQILNRARTGESTQ